MAALMTVAEVKAKISANYYGNYVEAALRKAKYQDMERTIYEVREALMACSGLKPVLDTFFFNDGSEKQLLALNGTIPIFFKGERYNIPIIIWILDMHPLRRPKIFLQPTSEMRIRRTNHINRNGRVRLPWQKPWNPVTSNLRKLIKDLVRMFERRPPLYSVS